MISPCYFGPPVLGDPVYGVKYDEIWCEGVVFKRGNIARITYNKKKKMPMKL
jgi:hypothetical protein